MTNSNNTLALITGANRGLGLATAQALGREGLRVVIGSRDGAAGEAAAKRLRSEGIDAFSVELDVTSEESLASAAKGVSEQFGRLDILVNNAGILPEATRPSEDLLDPETFRSTFDTNIFGAVAATRAFLPLLRESSAGHIVNVSSTMGSLADQQDPASPYFPMVIPAYQISKAALNGLTVVLAKALADTSITVNSVCPGWVQTDLGGPANRAAAPTSAEDAALVVRDLVLADGPTGTFVDATGAVAW